MPLIRAADVPRQVVHLNLRDFRIEAQSILQRAQAQAEQLLDEARQRADSMQADAHEQGHAAGWREGFDAGSEAGRQQALDHHSRELTTAMGTFACLSDSIESVRAQVESAALSDAVKLSLAIAQRICRRIGLIDPEVLRENLRDALKLATLGQQVHVAIHPAQRKLLENVLPQLGRELPVARGCEIIEDDSIAPGGCRIITRGGQIDATLDSQLDRLAALLLPAAIHGQTGSLFPEDAPGPEVA
jgi:flagellar assembly protein FliH